VDDQALVEPGDPQRAEHRRGVGDDAQIDLGLAAVLGELHQHVEPRGPEAPRPRGPEAPRKLTGDRSHTSRGATGGTAGG
jgi:hypothetical protein